MLSASIFLCSALSSAFEVSAFGFAAAGRLAQRTAASMSTDSPLCAKSGMEMRQPGMRDQAAKSSKGLPVISAGCGTPIIFSRVGAISDRAPALASFALRPT